MQEIRAAIEVTEAGGWVEEESANGVTFKRAESQGWTIRVGYTGSLQDGTAVQGSKIVHLTPFLAEIARARAEGQ